MAANDIFEIVLRGQIANIGACYNVFHVRDEGGSGDIAGVPQALLNALDVTNFYLSLPDDVTWGEATYAKIAPGAPGPQISVAVTKAGTGSLDFIPQQAMVCKWITATGGRSARGRSYFGPLGEGSTTAGRLVDTAYNALQAAADAVVAAYGVGGTETADFTIGVWSRKLSTFYPITAAAARRIAYTQRRRIPGVGI
jgi:hypothetical protein